VKGKLVDKVKGNKEMEEQLEEFCKLCTYVSGQYTSDEDFIKLREHCEEREHQQEEQNRVFYMALPPSAFQDVSEHAKRNVYPKKGIARLIVSLRFHIPDEPTNIMMSTG
jgi:glucose-6-phosphate 1-dehydrogenase